MFHISAKNNLYNDSNGDNNKGNGAVLRRTRMNDFFYGFFKCSDSCIKDNE